MQGLTRVVATFFGIGYLPLAPGTWASAAGAALCWYVFPEDQLPYWTLFFTAMGLWACLPSRVAFRSEDPKQFVMDEVCGVMISVLWIPMSAANYVSAFLLFRLFDVWKPWPISRLQASAHPWSIMGDDLLAGVFANLILQGFLRVHV
jgi:phosphatidylglycerophosphatase A